MSDMPEQFIIGSMKGSYIHQLSSLIEDIMKPILNLQLRVPTIHEKNVIETSMEADESNDKIIDFSRPSDYRMKAIEATQLGVSVGDDASHLSGTSRMSTVGTATSTESLAKTGNTPYEGKYKLMTVLNTFYPLEQLLKIGERAIRRISRN